MELDVDFTDQANARFLFVTHFDIVEFIDEVAKVALEGFKVGFLELLCAFFLPLMEQGFGRTLDLFIRPRAVQDLLQGVAVNHAHDEAVPEAESRLETGLLVHTLHIEG